ncbi:NAD-binding protein [Rubritalea tangerina]|uniref:NAD-binding protein n=1 Tax=Rubritalea tangerina TaxID=430798 RepID=UPI00361E37A0
MVGRTRSGGRARNFVAEAMRIRNGGQIEGLQDHVVICGYGPVGQNLHRNLLRANVGVVVLETNPETVKRLHAEGVAALFADASDKESLELAHIERARGIAFTFPDEQAVLKSMHSAVELNLKCAFMRVQSLQVRLSVYSEQVCTLCCMMRSRVARR